MKTITLELPDEVAEELIKLTDEVKVRLITKSLQPSKSRFEELLALAAKQARENGMTETEIEEFIESIS